jgi:hypothetical protein
MSRKARVLILFVIIEAALAGLWWYLARYGLANPGRVTSDYQAVVGQTLGMAMGGLLGIGFVLFLVAARNDRKAIKGKAL